MCYPCGGQGYNLVPAGSPGTDILELDPKPETDLEGDDTTLADYSALYQEALAEAERERQNLLDWLWKAEDFGADFKAQFHGWLSGLDLSAPGMEATLKATVDQWDVPGRATKTGTFLLLVRGLASRCGMVDLYKTAG